MNLRRLMPKDVDGMLSWMHDKEVNKVFQANFSEFTKDDVRKFIDNSWNEAESINFACVDDDDNYLGTVSLKNINMKAKNAEYAVSFCRASHGTGAASYATKEILKYAFNTLKLERVYLNVLSDNLRANAFYKKMGFVFEGTFKKHICIGGELHDLNWYRILKEEFENL